MMKDEKDDMEIRRKYYQTREEVEKVRKSGERVYYDADEEGYYIVKVKKGFWGRFRF